MALFGSPVAHEDHAQRACRSALAIQTRIKDHGERIKAECGVEFRIRIGLNSGPSDRALRDGFLDAGPIRNILSSYSLTSSCLLSQAAKRGSTVLHSPVFSSFSITSMSFNFCRE